MEKIKSFASDNLDSKNIANENSSDVTDSGLQPDQNNTEQESSKLQTTFYSPSESFRLDITGTHTVALNNVKTGDTKEINVEDDLKLTTDILKIEWINDDTVAIISHINPSLLYLCLYNASNNKIIDKKYGDQFDWDSDNNNDMLYVQHSPHFSNFRGNDKILNSNDEVLYTTDPNVIVSDITKKDNTVCWMTKDTKNNEFDINQGKLNSNKLEITKKSKWSGKLGKLSWKKDSIILNSEDVSYTINPDNLAIKETHKIKK